MACDRWTARHAESVLALLRDGPATVAELSERLLLEYWQVSRALRYLRRLGKVRFDGTRWWLAGVPDEDKGSEPPTAPCGSNTRDCR